jgi:Predicted nucleic-acid-binding protein containing a Zn-ribbon
MSVNIQIAPVNSHYWSALAKGELHYQRCQKCGHSWLPARETCPRCLSEESEWVPSSGRGKILSWISYHKAYAPHLADRIPYNVAIVELDEGPRLITNIITEPPDRKVSVGAEVVLKIEKDFGLHLPRFRLASPKPMSE